MGDRIGGNRGVPSGARPLLHGHALGRPGEVVDQLVVVQHPHLARILIDELAVQRLADGVDPEFLEILGERRVVEIADVAPRHFRQLFRGQPLQRRQVDGRELLGNLLRLRHLADVVGVDRIAVEALVRFHIGEKLMILATPQRHVGIEEVIDVLPRREEMARPEGVRVAAVIARAHAGAEKRRAFHQRHIPSAHQLQLMGGGTAGKSAADDQRSLHSLRAFRSTRRRTGAGRKERPQTSRSRPASQAISTHDRQGADLRAAACSGNPGTRLWSPKRRMGGSRYAASGRSGATP